uniref:Uncharacterized protein n=1 Tax=Micrurus lemniscatus lemniscatus TaxID=129467 RepID=A0A2D4HHM8_MICLE
MTITMLVALEGILNFSEEKIFVFRTVYSVVFYCILHTFPPLNDFSHKLQILANFFPIFARWPSVQRSFIFLIFLHPYTSAKSYLSYHISWPLLKITIYYSSVLSNVSPNRMPLSLSPM